MFRINFSASLSRVIEYTVMEPYAPPVFLTIFNNNTCSYNGLLPNIYYCLLNKTVNLAVIYVFFSKSEKLMQQIVYDIRLLDIPLS